MPPRKPNKNINNNNNYYNNINNNNNINNTNNTNTNTKHTPTKCAELCGDDESNATNGQKLIEVLPRETPY